MQETLSIEARNGILVEEIGKYTHKGFRVVSQTDTTAQLTKPKQFSLLWAFLWFLLFGVGLLIYILYYLAKSDKLIFIEVNEFGRVNAKQ